MHNRKGPAILYGDGFSVYSIHGVRIPSWIIETPEKMTVEDIKKETNAEVRRLMREFYGEGKYLHDIGAKIIDTDSITVDKYAPKGTHIIRTLIEDDEGIRYLIGSDGSTTRTYYMQTDRQNPPNTCVEAHEQLSGF